MATRSSSSPQRRPPPTRSHAGPIAIAIIVGVVLIVGVVVALVAGGGDDDDGEATSVSTTPNGVAVCPPVENAGSAPESSASESDATLAAFPDDDMFKPVAVRGAALPAFTEAIQNGAVDIGLCEPVPVVSGYDYAGHEITIDPANDGPTMVVLLAHWCPHCNREIPVLNEWRDSGDVPEDLNIVGVSTGITSARENFPPDEWLTRMDWQWPVLADSDAGADDPNDDLVSSALRAYGGTSFPTMILIGSDGRLLARFSGEVPADEIAARVDDALAQDAAASS